MMARLFDRLCLFIVALAIVLTFLGLGVALAVPTPTPQACCGDCSGGGATTTIANCLVCLDIFAGNQPLSNCPQCDCNGDTIVDIGEVTVCVNNENGCPGQPTNTPTPTATSTPTPTKTPTSTPTATATATRTQPGGCCGDLDGDHSVTLAEYNFCLNTCLGLCAPYANPSCAKCSCPGAAAGCVESTDFPIIALNSIIGCPGQPTHTMAPTFTLTPTKTPTKTPTVNTCGDGVSDAGEQCDNGVQNGMSGQCCSPICHINPNSFPCRFSVGVCDLTEVCNGINSTCPADAHLGDGTVCGADACQTCLGGVCQAACTPTATPAPTNSPTPSPTHVPQCCGDIDGDGFISASELSVCSLDALNGTYHSACDCDSSGMIDISDITTISPFVGLFCPGALPTPTFTRTPTITKTPRATATKTNTAPTQTATPEPCRADVHNKIPVETTDFLPDTQNFMCREDANRYAEQSHGFAYQGGFNPAPFPPAGLTLIPGAPLIAYIQTGYYAVEAGAVSFPDNSYCWLIAADSKSGNLGQFNRIPLSHYLISCFGDPNSKPALPVTAIWLEKVITLGGGVVGTIDLRARVPWAITTQFNTELPLSDDRRADIAFSVDDQCFYLRDDAGWTALYDSRNFKVVTVTYQLTPASLGPLAYTQYVVLFAGATTGDRCISGLSTIKAGVFLSSIVTNTDTVTVELFNATGATINLLAGSLQVTCFK